MELKERLSGATNQATNKNEQIYCLGELVHNKQVIKKLQNLGIKCIEKIEDANRNNNNSCTWSF